MLTLGLIIALTVTAALQLPPQRTVQVSLNVNSDILIENSDGKRIGIDFKTGKLVNEIPDARMIDGEMAPFVLPYDKSGKLYKIMVTGKSEISTPGDLSMTGPGFVVGVRRLVIRSGLIHTINISSNGSVVSITTTRDGEMPQLLMTTQWDRIKPSYRFEVGATRLSRGKTMTLELNPSAGRLYVKSTETKQLKFAITMRRTNPDGSRDTFIHRQVSFAPGNSYAIDFGQWDGKGDVCFYDSTMGEAPCTPLKNEGPAKQPN